MPEKQERSSAETAEEQIRRIQKIVDYQIREYPVEVLVDKHLMGQEEGTNEIFIPDYQRDLVWAENQQSRFIESILMGLPIPYLFVADVSSEDEDLSGRVEVVDGTQRMFSGNVDSKSLKGIGEIYGFRTLVPAKTRDGADLLPIKTNRNDLAHGFKSFEEIGRAYPTRELLAIAMRATAYMAAILQNVDSYLDEAGYLLASQGADTSVI